MRERKPFGKRTKTSESRKIKKKYFLVFEGSDTEEIYFDKVNAMREEIGLNSLIELVTVVRSFTEEGWSNPKKILDGIINDLRERDSEIISYRRFFNASIDYICEQNKIISNNKGMQRSIWNTMKEMCEIEFQKTIEDAVEDIESIGNKIFEKLREKYNIENFVENMAEIIKYSAWSYEEEYDEICLIVDRDKESFISHPENDQYRYVLEKCKEQGFRFCVTNPCFEFWLLMHFGKVLELDKQRLLNNEKVTSKRRYAEDELSKIFKENNKNYRKSIYDAGKEY